MKVRTDYVPEESLDYLTPGKEYGVVSEYDGGGDIVDDKGDMIYVYFPNSAHLDERPWQIVEEVTPESPITTECDALREEIEMLAADNRRLQERIRSVLSSNTRILQYPEAAVRAVWDHGHENGDCPWGMMEEEVARIFTEALQKGE